MAIKNIDMSKVFASASENRQSLRLVCDYIEADELKDNPENEEIYGKLDVDDLAKEIVRSGGVKEPVEVVKKEDGLYIISGHRRKLATLKAFEENLLPSKKIPYFVTAFETDDDERLALIGRNTQRQKTYDIRLKEVTTVTEILSKHKDKISGNFRTYVAEYLGMSETDLQRYWDFNKKLSQPILKAVSTGKMSFTTASEFTSLDDDTQKEVFEKLDKTNELKTKNVRALKKAIKKGLPIENANKEISKPDNKPSTDYPKPKTSRIKSDNINDTGIELNAIKYCLALLTTQRKNLDKSMIDIDELDIIARQEYLDKLITICQTDISEKE